MKISGEIKTAKLAELFQWIETQHKTGSLSLVAGALENTIYFSQGLIAGTNAPIEAGGEGEKKIRLIIQDALKETGGHFEFVEVPLPPIMAVTNLQLAIGQILVDACRGVNPITKTDHGVGVDIANPPQVAAKTMPSSQTSDLKLVIIDRLLTGKFKVPLLPTVANKVMEITRREQYSLNDLSQVILTDPVIAANVLKQANSALFGGAMQVDTLPMAIQRIGSETVTNLVFALSLQGKGRGHDPYLGKKNRLWQHAAACALFARYIALPVRLDHNLTFLCGLMQDFGKIVLLSIIQDVSANMPDSSLPSDDLVEEILETYHPKVGKLVGEKWNLPVQVIETMTYHHDLISAGEYAHYAAVASLSEAFVNLLTNSAPPESEDQLDEHLLELSAELISLPANLMLGLTTEQLASILARGPDCLKSAQEMMGD